MNTCIHSPSSLSWTSAHGVVPPTSKGGLQTSANLYGIHSPSQMHSGTVFDDASASHNLAITIPYSKDYQFLIGNICNYSDKVFIPSSSVREHSKFLCFVNLQQAILQTLAGHMERRGRCRHKMINVGMNSDKRNSF